MPYIIPPPGVQPESKTDEKKLTSEEMKSATQKTPETEKSVQSVSIRYTYVYIMQMQKKRVLHT